MSQRETDLEMLADLLDKPLDELTEKEMEAFLSMRFDLKAYPADIAERHGFRNLTDKQRSWLTSVHQRVIPHYANLASSGLIPPPKKPGEPGYVALMVGPLPKKPPMPQHVVPQRASAEHQPFAVTGFDEKEDE
jgi:hypothetical protein